MPRHYLRKYSIDLGTRDINVSFQKTFCHLHIAVKRIRFPFIRLIATIYCSRCCSGLWTQEAGIGRTAASVSYFLGAAIHVGRPEVLKPPLRMKIIRMYTSLNSSNAFVRVTTIY